MRRSENKLALKFALSSGFALLTLFSVVAISSHEVVAQETANPPGTTQDHSAHQVSGKSLVDQLRELQQKVAQLEAVLKQNHTGQNPSGMGGMRMREKGMEMAEKGMKMGMKQMQGGGMKGMSNPSDTEPGGGMNGMGKGGMGSMMSGNGMMGGGMMSMMGKQPGGMGSMSMPTALPGFPGASHLYHVGATGFFLDHANHITLTSDQQKALNELKQEALLKQDEAKRKIEATEQKLWQLTSSDAPKIDEIEAAIRSIESLRGDQRIAFIRRVGEAAQQLTEEQRHALIGTLPEDHAQEK